ncbi:sugar phosphate nucleotidyltransferase, partial [Uliginosibacterium sediminicola]
MFSRRVRRKRISCGADLCAAAFGCQLGAILKAVILAGGLGTRISEETHLKPKPMIEIGGKPILWHIMKIYS